MNSQGLVELGKKDLMVPLSKVEHILCWNLHRLEVEKIAELCSLTVRATYGDLPTPQHELGVPVSKQDGKRGVVEGWFLRPTQFTLPEAIKVFLAARLMLSYAHRSATDTPSTFMRRKSIVSAPVGEQIQETMGWMQQPGSGGCLYVQLSLAQAWVLQHQVKISHRALYEKKAVEPVIEPYFIEPAAGRSSYVIAYCHRGEFLRSFETKRVQAIEASSEPHVLPADFDADVYVGCSWGIVVWGEVDTIKLRFSPEVGQIVEEAVWHPSRVLDEHSDGSTIMILRVAT